MLCLKPIRQSGFKKTIFLPLIFRLIESLPKAAAHLDIRVLNGFLKILKNIFLKLNFDQKLDVMRTFYAKIGMAAYQKDEVIFLAFL